ncbi:MAG: polyprenyl synthetase family protein [Treponema sp.]|nr:polyprenyl synthetase family protein [Treponema sp.]
MSNEFKCILERIENALNKALPKSSAEGNWKVNSFGQLPSGAETEYIDKLIEPNKRLVELGGKRWRPLFLILSYQMACKMSGKPALSEEQTYSITPLIEFVHTASLIHDDIEDSADLRRGKPAAHISFGLDTALNAASWLYFEAPVCINQLDVNDSLKLELYKVYTNELRRLHLGQAMDIFWHRNPCVFPPQNEYLAMVKSKTGTLASLAAKLGCIAGGLSFAEAEKFGEIAADIGMGFQIIDDVINLTTGNVGKKRGDDIVEGKKSLPVLIHAELCPQDKNQISECMEEAAAHGIDSPAVENCIAILSKSGCIQKAAERGRKLIEESCSKISSAQITELFTSMIPETFL